MKNVIRFTARIIRGSGRGQSLGVPTMNLDLHDVPQELPEGVLACRVYFSFPSEDTFTGVLYHGPRPTFDDGKSCEVHVIDLDIPSPPETVEVEIVKFLRGVEKFPSADALAKEMQEDIAKARDILHA